MVIEDDTAVYTTTGDRLYLFFVYHLGRLTNHSVNSEMEVPSQVN